MHYNLYYINCCVQMKMGKLKEDEERNRATKKRIKVTVILKINIS